MLIDVLFDTFSSDWKQIRDGALAAEQAGLSGVWLNDHLAGSVQGANRVLECWTTLTAIAAAVPRIMVGSLVLNVANRDAGTLAVMAATLQEVSGGRLLLGLGAGARHDTSYAVEQLALGRAVLNSEGRRRYVEDAVTRLRAVWSGSFGGAAGFLRPQPPPPIILAGSGPKMAALAGRIGDGMSAPAGPLLSNLIDIARDAHEQSGRDPSEFVVTASTGPSPRDHERLAELGVTRAIAYLEAPYLEGVARISEASGI
jgi:alkanesulfonate monooxygenase SsuD/methylene tetrahydromethanopterin reductase-like flavin-dependent oxidoreductase (luciferase family)